MIRLRRKVKPLKKLKKLDTGRFIKAPPMKPVDMEHKEEKPPEIFHTMKKETK